MHLRSKQHDAAPHPVLAGPVELLRESGCVGRGEVGSVAPGERFARGWGADDGLRARRAQEEAREVARLTGKQTITRTVTLSLSNLEPLPAALTPEERAPVSGLEQVRIDVDEAKTVPAARADAQGIVAWPVSLPARGAETVALVYRVVAPGSVRGLRSARPRARARERRFERGAAPFVGLQVKRARGGRVALDLATEREQGLGEQGVGLRASRLELQRLLGGLQRPRQLPGLEGHLGQVEHDVPVARGEPHRPLEGLHSPRQVAQLRPRDGQVAPALRGARVQLHGAEQVGQAVARAAVADLPAPAPGVGLRRAQRQQAVERGLGARQVTPTLVELGQGRPHLGLVGRHLGRALVVRPGTIVVAAEHVQPPARRQRLRVVGHPLQIPGPGRHGAGEIAPSLELLRVQALPLLVRREPRRPARAQLHPPSYGGIAQ